MAAAELKFDEHKVSTELAKEYLNKKKEFHSILFDDSGEYELNRFNQKIYSAANPYQNCEGYVSISSNEDTVKSFNFIKKIEDNVDLFCQLEYLIRNIPVKDTKSIDLKLIIQSLLYQSMYKDAQYMNRMDVKFGDKTPLFHLGLFAWVKYPVTVYCTKETVAVCTLFVELAHEVGFEKKVRLAIVKSLDDVILDPTCEYDVGDNCVGVVSEKSDIDSAVDTFLSATTRYPWKLNKIFVQESVMLKFKRAIDWKTNLHSERVVDERLRDFSSATYVCEDKTFVHEFVGDEALAGSLNLVRVEAYRTVKELLSLMRDLRPFSLSLWSSDVAESNEIAHGLNTDIVWINGYENFHGPPMLSEALYFRFTTPSNTDTLDDDKKRVLESWLKMSVETRFAKIYSAYQCYNKDNRLPGLSLTSNSCVSVAQNVCIVTRKPVEVVFRHYLIPNNFDNLVKYIIDGGALVITDSYDNSLIKNLEKIGAPIFYIPKISGDSTPMYRTKVIWTNIGTIFAN